MIRCTPNGICSWNFTLQGDGHRGSTTVNWIGEQGSITADGEAFEVLKGGMASGHWTLSRRGRSVVEAQKDSAFARTFELTSPMGDLALRAESAMRRAFRLERGRGPIATVTPDHMFTRRATIELHAEDADFPTVCFAFWLAVLTWRRTASNS